MNNLAILGRIIEKTASCETMICFFNERWSGSGYRGAFRGGVGELGDAPFLLRNLTPSPTKSPPLISFYVPTLKFF